MKYFIAIVFAIFLIKPEVRAEINTSMINAYHFHTYFFQNNNDSVNEAIVLREKIQELTQSQLAGCRLNIVNMGPRGPHPIGSYETCCNATAINAAQSFFMQNHGSLSILLHALTRYEVLDHTERAMWMGKSLPLDIARLSPLLEEEPECSPLPDVF